jgi:hypothetical protein
LQLRCNEGHDENRHFPVRSRRAGTAGRSESVLQDGETLSSFVEQSIREGIERRRLQSEFIARGIASRDEARRTGNMCRRPRYWNDWAGSSTRCVPGHDRRDDVYGSLHTGGIP